MPPNRRLLEQFLADGTIDLQKGDIFANMPEPSGPELAWQRLEGMLLGLAIGDALGNTTESMLPQERRRRYGEIRDYLPNRHVDGRCLGLPSDDTQLTFWTLEQLLADGEFRPDRVAARFCQGLLYGLGDTVREFLRNYRDKGLPWYRCGPKSAGNGSLMRIAPLILPHLRSATPDLWVDTALAAMLTHNDSGAIAACLAFVKILWDLFHLSQAPEPSWWPRTYVAVSHDLEQGRYRPRGGADLDFSGPIWQFVAAKVEAAYGRGLSVLEAGRLWYSGAYLLETVPSVLYILMCHGHDPEMAIIRAVNDTKDNDTIAALVGAAVGALHGRDALPERWLAGLTGRTAANDDGRIFALLDAAREEWGQSP